MNDIQSLLILFSPLFKIAKKEIARLEAIEYRKKNKYILRLKDKIRNEKRKEYLKQNCIKNKSNKNNARNLKYKENKEYRDNIKNKSLLNHYNNKEKNNARVRKYHQMNIIK